VSYERLIYTPHARRRMTERNISEADVLRVMNDPETLQADARIISAIDLEEGS
jgi:Domain of unknown function (DUF4258)